MSEAARKPAPVGRLRVAVHAVDLSRRSALSRVVAEAGHVVVGAQDAADVILGGSDHDLPGVLSRDAGASQIDAAIRAVAAGLVVRLPEAMDTGFGAMRETDARALLTPRELEVLAALAEGMTNKTIARRLNISLHTVKFHVESLFRKLGARTRTEAVAKASERRRYETITL